MIKDKIFCKDCGFYGQDDPERTYRRNCMNKVCFSSLDTPESTEVIRIKDITDLNTNNDCIYFVDKEKVNSMGTTKLSRALSNICSNKKFDDAKVRKQGVIIQLLSIALAISLIAHFLR